MAGPYRRAKRRLARAAATAFLRAAATAFLLAAVMGLAAVAAPHGQSTTALEPSGASAPWQPPRTPWGDPDLQGLWPSLDMQGTPFERAVELGERAELNDAEFALREAQNRRQATADAETHLVAPRFNHGPPSHWAERGTPARQASLIVEPPDGRLPPRTAEGKAREDALRSTYYYEFPDRVAAHPFNDFTDLGPSDRCITRGVLASILPSAYNTGNEIVQAPGFVVIRNEMIHEARVIPLDGRPHVGEAIRQYMGDSRGRWEGETLVVETRNFNGRVGLALNGNATPASESLRITERFTRLDADTLQYEATIDDVRTWIRPWTVTLPLKRHADYRMYEYACHEGNHALRNIFSGARAAEAAATAFDR